jgi:endonuclease YncB( thermonuclease family)
MVATPTASAAARANVLINMVNLPFLVLRPVETNEGGRPFVPNLTGISGTCRSSKGLALTSGRDTIDIAGVRIRLEGIDAPESGQACADADGRKWLCGHAATHALIEHIGGWQLRCESSGFDRYRRVLAVCALPDGSDVNAWLVQQGWAMAYGYSSPYRTEEAEAHAAKRGIWAGSFMPPWEWRRRHPF